VLAIVVFLAAAALAVLGGLGVVMFHQPMRSVLSLVVVMLALSVIFLLLNAQFVFAVQIIVYAGAVMVLFLFVIALLGPARELGRGRLRFQTWLSALFLLVLLGLMWSLLQGVQYRQPEKADLSYFGSVQSIAVGLFTTYLYPFELTSILLLVAAIGAIYLSRKRIDDPEGGPAEGLGPTARVGGNLPPHQT
jgi:NADH-quinone oxidoreductase subunit J